MIASISERNRSRRVFFPLFCHARLANVCCFVTLVSVFDRWPSIDENYVFHSIGKSQLVQRLPSGAIAPRANKRRFVNLLQVLAGSLSLAPTYETCSRM